MISVLIILMIRSIESIYIQITVLGNYLNTTWYFDMVSNATFFYSLARISFKQYEWRIFYNWILYDLSTTKTTYYLKLFIGLSSLLLNIDWIGGERFTSSSPYIDISLFLWLNRP